MQKLVRRASGFKQISPGALPGLFQELIKATKSSFTFTVLEGSESKVIRLNNDSTVPKIYVGSYTTIENGDFDSYEFQESVSNFTHTGLVYQHSKYYKLKQCGYSIAEGVHIVDNVLIIQYKYINHATFQEIVSWIQNTKEYSKNKTKETLVRLVNKVLPAKIKEVSKELVDIKNKVYTYQNSISDLNSRLEDNEILLSGLKHKYDNISDTSIESILNFDREEIESYSINTDGDLLVKVKSVIAHESTWSVNTLIKIPSCYILIKLGSELEPFYRVDKQDELRTGLSGSKLIHPHVISPTTVRGVMSYSPCWGNSEHIMRSHCKSYNIVELVNLMIDFLTQFNKSDSAGRHYVNWPKFKPN